jgi:hypothetical protein
MGSFESVHDRRVVGSLAMFDRMIFKGQLMRLYHPGGVRVLLWNLGYPLTQFALWTKAATEALCVHAQRTAEEAGRPTCTWSTPPRGTRARPGRTWHGDRRA